MKQQIRIAVNDAKNLAEIRTALLQLFQNIKQQENQSQIGYVAGILYSDGPEYFERNRQLLAKRTEMIRSTQTFPIFSAYDIFSDGIYDQIEERKLSVQDARDIFIQFWRDILGSGLISDIFMTPRWEFSEGAKDEHQTAQKFGLTIHYFHDQQ